MSRYSEFNEKAKSDIEAHRERTHGNGGFDYNEQVTILVELQNKLNLSLLKYMFGGTAEEDRFAKHLMEKFITCNRNLLQFFHNIDRQTRFYILHELKTNASLFAWCS